MKVRRFLAPRAEGGVRSALGSVALRGAASGRNGLLSGLPKAEYVYFELPCTARLGGSRIDALPADGRLVVLDEIHRYDNASELLKMAADSRIFPPRQKPSSFTIDQVLDKRAPPSN